MPRHSGKPVLKKRKGKIPENNPSCLNRISSRKDSLCVVEEDLAEKQLSCTPVSKWLSSLSFDGMVNHLGVIFAELSVLAISSIFSAHRTSLPCMT